MTLIKCTECEKQISDKAAACPHCGAPNVSLHTTAIANAKFLNQASLKAGVGVFIFAVVLIGGFVVFAPGRSSSDAKLPTAATSGDSSKTTSSPTTSNPVEELVRTGQIFPPGTYAQGRIPKGPYIFMSEKGGYYSEEKDGEILDNENFPSFGHVFAHGIGDITSHGYLITDAGLKALGYASAKSMYENITKQSNYKFSGYYHVGTDIEPGRYLIESAGSGYMAVNSGPVGKSEIIQNDVFNGSKTVKIQSGQYLQLNRASVSALPGK